MTPHPPAYGRVLRPVPDGAAMEALTKAFPLSAKDGPPFLAALSR